jgi:hypothetical protein
MIVVQVISFVLIFVIARYRLLLVACLIPFAVDLVLRLPEWLRRRSWPRLGGAGLLLAATSIVVFLPVGEFPRDAGFGDQYAFLGDRQLARGEFAAAAESFEAALASSWHDERTAERSRVWVRAKLAFAWANAGRDEEAKALARELLDQLARTGRTTEDEGRAQLRQLLETIEAGLGQGAQAPQSIGADSPEP